MTPFYPGIGIKTIFSQHYLGMLSHLFRLFWTNGSYEEDFQRFLSFLVQKIYSIPFGSPTYPEARDGTNIGWTLPEDVSANVSAFLAKWFFRKALNNLFIPFVNPPPPKKKMWPHPYPLGSWFDEMNHTTWECFHISFNSLAILFEKQYPRYSSLFIPM